MVDRDKVSDSIVGAIALDIAKNGSSEVATALLSNAVQVRTSREYVGGSYRYYLTLLLPLDYMDMLDGEVSKQIVHAAKRAGLSCTSVRQRLAPAATGWRDHLAELEDWASGELLKDAWVVIDERVSELKALFSRSVTPDDLADVGRRCRELLIAAANATYRPMMLPEGHEAPKEGDAKSKCRYIVEYVASNSLDKRVSNLVDNAWDVAVKLSHHQEPARTATFVAAQATIVVVRTLALIEADLQRAQR
jgi:hypothetical protein